VKKIIFFNKMEKIFDNFDDQQNEEVSMESVFGLWKGRDVTKETLRKKAWMKNKTVNVYHNHDGINKMNLLLAEWLILGNERLGLVQLR